MEELIKVNQKEESGWPRENKSRKRWRRKEWLLLWDARFSCAPQDAHPPVLTVHRLKSILSHRFASDYQRTTRCAPRASYGKYWLPSRVKTSFSCSEDVALRDKPGVTKNYSALSVTANSRPRGRSLLRTESYTPGSVPPITTMKGPSRWSGHKPMK